MFSRSDSIPAVLIQFTELIRFRVWNLGKRAKSSYVGCGAKDYIFINGKRRIESRR